MINEQVSLQLQKAVFVNDEIARRLTPKSYRGGLTVIGLGHTIACLIGLILFMPLIALYFEHGHLLRSALLFFLIVSVMMASLSFVSLGKQSLIKIIEILGEYFDKTDVDKVSQATTKILSPMKQMGFGLLFGLPITVLAQAAPRLGEILFIRLSTSFAVLYVAFLVGTGFYLVICTFQILSQWSTINYKLPTFLPYQSFGLKRIADIGVSMSLSGSITAAIISALVFGLRLQGNIPKYTYWTTLMFGAIVVSWVTISVPFITSQLLIMRIIKHAKEVKLSRLSHSIQQAFDQIDGTNKESVERLEKIQNLYDQVYKSPDTVLGLGIVSKYVSSLLLVAIPSVIGKYIESLVK